MEKTKNLQDAFLNRARSERVPVTMFLMNGFQMRGVLRAFDNFTVIIDSDGKQQTHLQARYIHHCAGTAHVG